MKKVLFAVLILINLTAFADVTITEDSSGSKIVTYFSDNMSAHFIDGQVTNITDMGKGLIYAFNPMNRTYFQATFKEMQEFADKAAEQFSAMSENPQYKQFIGKASGGDIKIQKIGSKKIAGYSCEEYKLTSQMSSSSLCFSRELMDLIKKEVDTSRADKLMNSLDMEGSAGGMAVKIAEFEEKYGYIMSEKSSSLIPGMGAESETLVTSVSKGKVSGSVFKVPAGFKKISLKDAMGDY